MKKIIFVAALLAPIVSSCIEMDPSKMGTKPSTIEIDNKYLLTEQFELPIQQGSFTVVTRGSDTLAVTGIPLSIEMPKGAEIVYGTKSSRAKDNEDDHKIFIEHVKNLPAYDLETGVMSSDYVLTFEDSKINDYDYNDLVLYVEHKIVKNQQSYSLEVRVKPIALGSAKRIQFGYDDPNHGVERILSYDVRKDYFQNKTGFINTMKESTYKEVIPVLSYENDDETDWYTYFPNQAAYEQSIWGSYKLCRNSVIEGHKYSDPTKPANKLVKGGYFSYAPVITSTDGNNGQHKISYFIKVDNGVKYSVASIDKKIEGCLPYGLAIPGEFYYPIEYAPIWSAYPDFKEWIEGKKPSFHNGDKNSTEKVPEFIYEREGMEQLFRW